VQLWSHWYDDAETFFARVREINARVIEYDDYRVAFNLHGLAQVRRGQNRLNEEEALYQKADGIRNRGNQAGTR
jgi:hypothetical protein